MCPRRSPTSKNLLERLLGDRGALETAEPELAGVMLPADMLTASATRPSGRSTPLMRVSPEKSRRRLRSSRGSRLAPRFSAKAITERPSGVVSKAEAR